jgi:hypothetical protein
MFAILMVVLRYLRMQTLFNEDLQITFCLINRWNLSDIPVQRGSVG